MLYNDSIISILQYIIIEDNNDILGKHTKPYLMADGLSSTSPIIPFYKRRQPLLLYFYVAKVTRTINKAQITQAILNKFIQEHLHKSKIWVS